MKTRSISKCITSALLIAVLTVISMIALAQNRAPSSRSRDDGKEKIVKQQPSTKADARTAEKNNDKNTSVKADKQSYRTGHREPLTASKNNGRKPGDSKPDEGPSIDPNKFNRNNDRKTERDKDRNNNSDIGRDKNNDRNTDRDKDRNANRDSDRDRDKDRNANRDSDRDRDRDRNNDRDRDRDNSQDKPSSPRYDPNDARRPGNFVNDTWYRSRTFADDSWYRSRTRPNYEKSYHPKYTNTKLMFNINGLPFLVKRTDNCRVGYYRYYKNDYGYWSPRWRWCFYFFDPVVDECCYSPYYYYACVPGYVPTTRIIYVIRYTSNYSEYTLPEYYWNNNDYYLNQYNQYYTNDNSLSKAVQDIREAWEENDWRLLRNYLADNGKVNILLDGKYAYTMNADDFADLTLDAVEVVDTVSFKIESVKQRANGSVVIYGRHTYRLDDNDLRIVYVSYTLEKDRYGDYKIVEAGSSITKRLGN